MIRITTWIDGWLDDRVITLDKDKNKDQTPKDEFLKLRDNDYKRQYYYSNKLLRSYPRTNILELIKQHI